MNENTPPLSSSLRLFEPVAREVYSIETVAHLTQTPRHLIAVYCRHGLIAPIAPPEHGGWWFDDEAIRVLRHVQRLRDALRLELPALRVVIELQREIDRLGEEVRFLRSR